MIRGAAGRYKDPREEYSSLDKYSGWSATVAAIGEPGPSHFFRMSNQASSRPETDPPVEGGETGLGPAEVTGNGGLGPRTEPSAGTTENGNGHASAASGGPRPGPTAEPAGEVAELDELDAEVVEGELLDEDDDDADLADDIVDAVLVDDSDVAEEPAHGPTGAPATPSVAAMAPPATPAPHAATATDAPPLGGEEGSPPAPPPAIPFDAAGAPAATLPSPPPSMVEPVIAAPHAGDVRPTPTGSPSPATVEEPSSSKGSFGFWRRAGRKKAQRNPASTVVAPAAPPSTEGPAVGTGPSPAQPPSPSMPPTPPGANRPTPPVPPQEAAAAAAFGFEPPPADVEPTVDIPSPENIPVPITDDDPADIDALLAEEPPVEPESTGSPVIDAPAAQVAQRDPAPKAPSDEAGVGAADDGLIITPIERPGTPPSPSGPPTPPPGFATAADTARSATPAATPAPPEVDTPATPAPSAAAASTPAVDATTPTPTAQPATARPSAATADPAPQPRPTPATEAEPGSARERPDAPLPPPITDAPTTTAPQPERAPMPRPEAPVERQSADAGQPPLEPPQRPEPLEAEAEAEGEELVDHAEAEGEAEELVDHAEADLPRPDDQAPFFDDVMDDMAGELLDRPRVDAVELPPTDLDRFDDLDHGHDELDLQHTGHHDDEHALYEFDEVASVDVNPAAAAPPPASGEHLDPEIVVELRQVAGLTSGAVIDLIQDTYDFAEGDDEAGFSLSVDDDGNVVVIPGSVPASIDGEPVAEPTLLGEGVLDVATARFTAQPQRARLSPSELAQRQVNAELEEPPIAVPDDLVDVDGDDGSGRRGFKRKRDRLDDAANWEFFETVHQARDRQAERERHLHPDPTGLIDLVTTQAPWLGSRSYDHPQFGAVSIMLADLPWLPDFDDIRAIPDSVGFGLQPLLVLPSVPVVADLMLGPLGIVGSRAAATACARHLMTSLYAASTEDLRLHVVTSAERREQWEWARSLAPAAPLALADNEQSVVVIDGMELFAEAGFDHADAIERRVSAVILADAVDQLPSYCATVLQIADNGSGILTNHRGDVIHGTPIGIPGSIAAGLAEDLVPIIRQHQR